MGEGEEAGFQSHLVVPCLEGTETLMLSVLRLGCSGLLLLFLAYPASPSLPPNINRAKSVCKASSLDEAGQSDPKPPFESSGYFAAVTLAASRCTQHFFLWAHPVLVVLKPGLIVFQQLPGCYVSKRLSPTSQVAVFFFSKRCVVLFETHLGVAFPVVILF